MKKIDKDTKAYKKRKDKGQFFTPTNVVDIIIDNLPIKAENISILEPSCGDGAFVEKLYKGNELTAIDSDKEQVNYVKNKYKENIDVIYSDYLLYNTTKKFDLIIGNPPFNLPAKAYKDTTEGFVSKSIDLLKDNGYLVFILPNTILRNKLYQPIREKILRETTILKLIDTRGNDFMGADIETFVLFLKKTKTTKQAYDFISNGKIRKVNLEINNKYTIKFNNSTSYNKLKEKIGKTTIESKFNIYRGRSKKKDSLKGKNLNFYNDTLIYNSAEDYCIGLQNIAYRLVANVIQGNDNDISDTITILRPKEKMDYNELRFYANYLNTSIANYLIHIDSLNNSKLTMHIDDYYIKDICLPQKSLNNDDKFYLTLDENRNTKFFAEYREEHFEKMFYINNKVERDIKEIWQFPKFKKKEMMFNG